jgi:hypothetical protein
MTHPEPLKSQVTAYGDRRGVQHWQLRIGEDVVATTTDPYLGVLYSELATKFNRPDGLREVLSHLIGLRNPPVRRTVRPILATRGARSAEAVLGFLDNHRPAAELYVDGFGRSVYTDPDVAESAALALLVAAAHLRGVK